MAFLTFALLALASSMSAFHGARSDRSRGHDEPAITIVADGTAYFIKDGERITPGIIPFEQIRWTREPSAEALRAALPYRPQTWLYADFECADIARSGHLRGCRIGLIDDPRIKAASEQTLRLLRDYAVSREDAVRLRERTTGIHVSFQIQFAGITDMGDCGALGFCTITPPPPPPPPPRLSSGGS